MLKKLYDLKLEKYKEENIKELPHKLLAMLLLQEKDRYEVPKHNIENEEYYLQHKNQIDEKITQIERDFEFTKEEIQQLIEKYGFKDNYEFNKIRCVFGGGIFALTWGLTYHNDKSPEEIYFLMYQEKDFILEYIKEMEQSHSISSQELGNVIVKLSDYYSLVSIILSKYRYRKIVDKLIPCTCSNCYTNCSGGKTYENSINCRRWSNEQLTAILSFLHLNNILQYNDIIAEILSKEDYDDILKWLEIEKTCGECSTNCGKDVEDEMAEDCRRWNSAKIRKMVFLTDY